MPALGRQLTTMDHPFRWCGRASGVGGLLHGQTALLHRPDLAGGAF
jgi:hypothetical protein